MRVQQGGTVEVIAGTTGSEEAVYFDNLRVEQTGGLIVQEQHQYAYGAPLPGLSYSVGNRRYRYGYQGQYAEHDSLTGFESFELRLYNSRIGRWLSDDPYGQYASPYVGMGNNPVSGVDPDGGWSGPGPSAFTVALKDVAITGKRAMSTGLKLGLQAGSSVLRVGNAYGRYTEGFYKGAGAGAVSTGRFVAGLTPWGANNSWGQLNNAGVAFLAPSEEKLQQLGNLGLASYNYLSKLPSMTAEELGYDVGYSTEKVAEGLLLDDALTGFNGLKSATGFRRIKDGFMTQTPKLRVQSHTHSISPIKGRGYPGSIKADHLNINKVHFIYNPSKWNALSNIPWLPFRW